MIPVGLRLGEVFAKPIQELRIATEKVMKGEWDYKIEVKTGDEIEQLSYAFKDMISNIKKRETELLQAKEELDELYKNLEKKVQERTKELSDSHAATLNILEDLSIEKKKVEKYYKELEDALRIKSDFISMVSHELRTPLTAIKEGISLVADGTTGPLNNDQKEFLDIAKRNVDRLARLINDILDLQRLEGGKLFLNLALNDINDAVSEVYNTMATVAKGKALTVELKLDRNLPRVVFDKDKIIQVLVNIVNNALRFTNKGGIMITTEKDINTIMVSVRDTGPGIRQEDIPRLFKWFEQLESGTERRTGGTGLGLAICKEIVEMHGGKIWAKSVFGEGTAIFFNLPIIERRGSHGKEDTHSR
jgi:signal transduction histidine kinase